MARVMCRRQPSPTCALHTGPAPWPLASFQSIPRCPAGASILTSSSRWFLRGQSTRNRQLPWLGACVRRARSSQSSPCPVPSRARISTLAIVNPALGELYRPRCAVSANANQPAQLTGPPSPGGGFLSRPDPQLSSLLLAMASTWDIPFCLQPHPQAAVAAVDRIPSNGKGNSRARSSISWANRGLVRKETSPGTHGPPDLRSQSSCPYLIGRYSSPVQQGSAPGASGRPDPDLKEPFSHPNCRHSHRLLPFREEAGLVHHQQAPPTAPPDAPARARISNQVPHPSMKVDSRRLHPVRCGIPRLLRQLPPVGWHPRPS